MACDSEPSFLYYYIKRRKSGEPLQRENNVQLIKELSASLSTEINKRPSVLGNYIIYIYIILQRKQTFATEVRKFIKSMNFLERM